MDYKYDKCPICGSLEIKIVGTKVFDDNNVFNYKCNSCDSMFSSENLLNRDILKTQKENDKNAQKLVSDIEEELLNIKNMVKSNAEKSKQIYKDNINSVVKVNCDFDDYVSNGTGIILDKYLIVTNAHIVIDKSYRLAQKYYVNYENSVKKIIISIIAIDTELDIALLKSNTELSNPVCIRDTEVETGEHCYTLGNAKGQGLSFFDGIIADSERIVDDKKYIMFTAPVTTGSSGGPIFDIDGKLIGMVRMGRIDTPAMNYAIPVDVIKNFVNSNKMA